MKSEVKVTARPRVVKLELWEAFSHLSPEYVDMKLTAVNHYHLHMTQMTFFNITGSKVTNIVSDLDYGNTVCEIGKQRWVYIPSWALFTCDSVCVRNNVGISELSYSMHRDRDSWCHISNADSRLLPSLSQWTAHLSGGGLRRWRI